MEKVKLTREQANAIEELLSKRSITEILRENFNPLIRQGIYVCETKNIVFKHLTDEMLVKALYVGYEVEPEFKEGDWIIDSFSEITKVLEVDKSGIIIEAEHGNRDWIGNKSDYYKEIRHATPEEIAEEKERRWWAKHDRKPWQLSLYDCLISKDKTNPLVIVGIDYDYLKNLGIIEFNNGWKVEKDDLKKSFDVLYFNSDRKDVDNE